MHAHHNWTWAALRGLAAVVFALGPALSAPASAAAPQRGQHAAPRLRPLADTPQSSPFLVNDFADTTDGACSVDHCTLREAVLAANTAPGADEIDLPSGTYVLDLVGAGEDAAATGDLDITEDLTLSGVTSATTIISGTYTAFGDRLFEITGTARVTISNVALTGGYVNGDGGAVLNKGRLTLSASQVYSNFASVSGGGVYNQFTPSSFSAATIEGSSLVFNTADGAGGGVAAGGWLTLTHSLLANNATTGYGGGVMGYPLSTLIISSTQLQDNTAGDGGGVAFCGWLTIANSQVIDNQANNDGGGYYSCSGVGQSLNTDYLGNSATNGGGVYSDGYFYGVGGLVEANSSSLDGGGLYLMQHTELTGLTINGNNANDEGGGLYLSAEDAQVTGTQVMSNSAQVGGGLYNLSTLTFTDSEVLSNTASEGGGLGNAGVLTLTSSLVISNTSYEGGGLHNLGRDGVGALAYVDSSAFIANTAPDGGGGGVFNAFTSTLTVTGTHFINNLATGAVIEVAGGGGLHNDGTAYVFNSTFTGNQAGQFGGGLDNRGFLQLLDSTVENNTSRYGGGLAVQPYYYFLTEPPFTSTLVEAITVLTRTTFTTNTAEYGGGVWSQGYLFADDSVIRSNIAITDGGGLNLASPDTLDDIPGVVLTSLEVSHNTASEAGGGLYLIAQALLSDTHVISNSAIGGGGIYNRGELQLSGGAVLSNTGLVGGGIGNAWVINITGTVIANNSADTFGGGLASYFPGQAVSLATIQNASFISNISKMGGGIMNGGYLTLTDSLLDQNSATYSGGGLYRDSAYPLLYSVLISGTTFQLNSAGTSGGGLSNQQGPIEIIGTDFISNTATIGGGLYNIAYSFTPLTLTSQITLTGSSFTGNSVSEAGGGILAAGLLQLTNVTLSGNHAAGAGGGLAAMNPENGPASVAQLANVTVVSNTAGGDGGGLYVVPTATVRLTNTLLAANMDDGGQAPDCAGPLTSGGYNLVGDPTGCALGGDLTGVLTNTAPLVAPLADNGGSTLTHALLHGSPALNAGSPETPGSSPSACEPTDQRGVSRPAGPRCDLGAFESELFSVTVQFESGAFSAGEAGPSLPFTVTLSAVTGFAVTVAYSTTNATATAGADYVAATGTLTFTAGVTTTTGAITLLPDALFEPDETFTITLGAPTNATLGAPAAATAALLNDDDPPTVAFSTAASSAVELSATTAVTVQLSAPASLTVTVNFTTTPGTATPGLDYAPAGGTLTFAPGVTQTQALVMVIGDSLDENDETFVLDLSAPVNATLGLTTTTQVSILDNDAPPSVQWSTAAYTATEESGGLTLTAALSAASGLTITVAYSATPGTALPGLDYAPLSGTLTFAPGQTQQPVTLTLTNDTQPELTESLLLALTSPSNAALGAPSTATVTIADADAYRLYLPLVISPPAASNGLARTPHGHHLHPAMRSYHSRAQPRHLRIT